MNVAELIDKLSEFPQDAPVLIACYSWDGDLWVQPVKKVTHPVRKTVRRSVIIEGDSNG